MKQCFVSNLRSIKRSTNRLMLPFRHSLNFAIAGEVKCGTFALYHYLNQHPQIFLPADKEPHFFNNNFNWGWLWYKTQFPYRTFHGLCGEATADYFFHPRTAPRMAEWVPHIKLIVLLRNPIDRAWSHYRHNLKPKPWIQDGRPEISESLSFGEALDTEEQRLAGERERLLADENYYSWNLEHYSYKARGRYIEQIEYWMKYFDKDHFLFLINEDLRDNRAAVLEEIFEFLEAQPFVIENTEDFHVNPLKGEIPASDVETLKGYFSPYNTRLEEYLQRDLPW